MRTLKSSEYSLPFFTTMCRVSVPCVRVEGMAPLPSALSKRGKVCPARSSAWLLLAVASLPLAVHSAEVVDSSVRQQQGRYLMHSETLIRAPVPKVRALLMNYENFPRLNPDIKRLESIEKRDDGGVRMSVNSAFCILAICMNFNWVQDVHFLPNGNIAMTIVPDHGDFQQGNGLWRLFPNDGGTRLIFDIDLTPKYWVPSVLGPWLMKQKLSEESFEFAEGLERMVTSSTCC
jgi:hypothetical protein